MKKNSGNAIARSSPSNDWEAENDLRTMLECEAIEADPKRLARVQALAKAKMLDMAKLASEGKDD
jgi:hypothetical protein